MKTSQLILATAVLMVMVFGITIAMNFLGSDAVTPPPPPPSSAAPAGSSLPRLIFENTQYPPGKDMAKEWEINHHGHADFWFSNPNDVEVRVALLSKSCKCTEAELFISNPEWDTWRARNARVEEFGPLAGPIVRLHLLGQESAMLSQQTQLTRYNLSDRSDTGFPVPPHTRGWVRLSWTAERKGLSPEAEKAQRLTAEIWMNHRFSDVTQPFEVRLVMFPVLRLLPAKETAGALAPEKAPNQLSLGRLGPRDLPRQTNLVFGSTTRAWLNLKAEADKPKFLQDGPDLFQVGQPQPLTREETQRLEAEVKDGPLMCAFRVPITLLDHVGDRLFDTGIFRRAVKVSINDGEIDPIEVPVFGIVEGDVEIGTPEDNGKVALASFERDQGRTREIMLASDVEGVKLELDQARVPDFIKATLEQTSKPGAARQTWKLTVSVGPNKASGPFPRDDHPAYRDSAIYLKCNGRTNRLIRIPVEGNAIVR